MAFASTTYTATAGQTAFVLPFDYVRGVYLEVFIDDVETAAWTVNGSTVTYSGTALTDGQLVKITRTTPIADDEQAVDFTSGAILTESDVETSRQQLLHGLQELTDRVEEAEGDIAGKPRGVTRATAGALTGNSDAAWFESTANRVALGSPTWEADNSTASTQWAITGGKLRLTLGTWRIRVTAEVERAFVAGAASNIDIRVVDDVTGSGVTTYFTSPSVPLAAAVDSRVSYSEVFELTLATQTDLNLLVRDDLAGGFSALLPGTNLEIERVS